mmetsp:Transcript_77741/g.240883  ORF Transcript_77741/g.240883 Transcript_77741/m.240883 type:complete len:254 (-) Transcript_77741:118-879(-)
MDKMRAPGPTPIVSSFWWGHKVEESLVSVSSWGQEPSHASRRSSTWATMVRPDTARAQERRCMCDPKKMLANTVISNSVPFSRPARSSSVAKRSICRFTRGRVSSGGGGCQGARDTSPSFSTLSASSGGSERGPGSVKKRLAANTPCSSSGQASQSKDLPASVYHTTAFISWCSAERLERSTESSKASLPAITCTSSGVPCSNPWTICFTWATSLDTWRLLSFKERRRMLWPWTIMVMMFKLNASPSGKSSAV